MIRRILPALVVASACSSSGPALDKATIGNLAFGAPSGWEKRDVSNKQRAMLEWVPSADDNDRKESITVIRADRPATAKATPAQLQHMLVEAQRGMTNATFAAPVSFTTRHGFRGVRVEGEFAPPGQSVRYRRIHAAFVDGTTVVNVLYTARDPDLENFESVLDSFFREGV